MCPITNFFVRAQLKLKIEQRRKRLYRLIYSWSHDPTLSDDIVQEALAKAIKNMKSLRDHDALDGWLLRILANCWKDHFRTHRNFENVDDLDLMHDETPERCYEKLDMVSSVRMAVAELPLGQRQVLTLVDLEGVAYAEVAYLLEIPIGTVMSRLCRARKALANRLLTEDQRFEGSNVYFLQGAT